MFKKPFFLLIWLYSSAVFATEIDTVLSKQESGLWWVTYQIANPVQRLVFQRNPDNSRGHKWRSLSSDFEITYQNKQEWIVRKDKQSFTRVAFELRPEYFPISKEYATFAPFSDDSVLIYTGRFFVCANQCDEDPAQFPIEIIALADEFVIVRGERFSQRARWLDSGEGFKVYIGRAEPIESEYFVSIVDSQLPLRFRQAIATDLPRLMDYFANHFGVLNFRPALFASYSERGNSISHQGGTLPGQVFVHWNGKSALEKMDPNSTYFLFAHEVAHLFQRDETFIPEPRFNWVHEGSADYFAALASIEVAPNSGVMNEKNQTAQRQCLEGLVKNRQFAKAVQTNPGLHYSCGFLVFQHIAQSLPEGTRNAQIFDLWNRYIVYARQQKRASIEGFLLQVKPLVSEQDYELLSRFSLDPDYDGLTFFQTLLKPQEIE